MAARSQCPGIIVLAFILATGLGNQALGQQQVSENDARMRSLTDHIESEMTTDASIPSDLLATLSAALQLMPYASPAGQQRLLTLPARLKAKANEQRAGTSDDSFSKATNLDVVADFAAKYIDKEAQSSTLPATPSEPPKVASAPPPPSEPPKVASAPPPPSEPPKVAAVSPPPPPSEPPKVASAPPKMTPDTLRILMTRGDTMLKQGNISAARMFYQRAAEDHVGLAAFKMGQTYDPEFLIARDIRGIKPDINQANAWYRKAAALGEPQAEQRLKETGRQSSVATQ